MKMIDWLLIFTGLFYAEVSLTVLVSYHVTKIYLHYHFK